MAVVVAFVSEAYRGARIIWVFGVRFNKIHFSGRCCWFGREDVLSAPDAGRRSDGWGEAGRDASRNREASDGDGRS